MEIKLLHLYYDIMNLYGEYGNIKILEKHLQDQGFEVIVDRKTIGETKNFKEYDFVYIGCGTEKNQEFILQDMQEEKEEFRNIIEDGKVVLLTGNSYEILGRSLYQKNALGLLDFETEYANNRFTADVIFKANFLKNQVVGFINTMGAIKNNKQPLFEVEWSSKNIGDNHYEGVMYKNLIGTHLIGPVLVRNPEILRYIIEKICKQKDENYIYKDIEYIDEQKGYELVLKELQNRKEQ